MEKTQNARPDWEGKCYSFFQNRQCEYFPCHTGVPEEDFNCIFCYCPLYALGDGCGGGCRWTESGCKDCSGCTIPHRRENYGRIIGRYTQVAALAAANHKQEKQK